MRIVFCDFSQQDYTPGAPARRPLGGTQSALCYLTQALAERGHDVTLLCRTSTPGSELGVRCVAPSPEVMSPRTLNGFDAVVVATRGVGRRFREAGVTAPLVLWQHMHAASFAQDAFAPAERDCWDAVAFVSDDQRTRFVELWGLEGRVLRNAVSPAAQSLTARARFFFEDPDAAPMLIYASAPGRGLDLLLIAFPAIREALPGARLRVCSDMAIYSRDPGQDGYRSVYALARALPGVEFTGSVAQPELASAFAEADLWAYPTAFEETSCIVAMEAMAAGCLIAATDVGALRETCGPDADLMAPTPLRHELCTRFADLVVANVERARREPAATARRLRAVAERVRSEDTWAARAASWAEWLAEVAERTRASGRSALS